LAHEIGFFTTSSGLDATVKSCICLRQRSHLEYRRSGVEGGFSTWNLREDLTTSYNLHSAGYRSEYHKKCFLSVSPQMTSLAYSSNWYVAVDNWRLFCLIIHCSKKAYVGSAPSISGIGPLYATSSIFTPLLMLVPVIALATGQFIPIEGSALFP